VGAGAQTTGGKQTTLRPRLSQLQLRLHTSSAPTILLFNQNHFYPKS
jgi:hypothetical protein